MSTAEPSRFGHPYGVSGQRLVGHALLRGPAPRCQARVCVTMCIGGGMGAAGIFEVFASGTKAGGAH